VIQEKIVLVVGAGRGLGRAIAHSCVRQNYRIVVSARSLDELEETVEVVKAELGAQAAIQYRVCDVAYDEQVRALIAGTEEQVGPIYGLVCSAGVYGAVGHFDEIPFSEWLSGFNVNVFGVARCVHAAVPFMKKRQDGRIVLFSGGGQAAMPRFSSYVACKGAIWRLTETLAAELAPHGIYLNAIAPGAVNTRLLDEIFRLGPQVVGHEQHERSLKQKADGGVPATKSGDLVLYLLSEKSERLYGKIISAQYDRYWEIGDPEAASKSDLFTMRRVVTPEGATRY
jgi:NAD(P)-dependent dehydrogenase (short-subunit alcohol dehydrogenase family)